MQNWNELISSTLLFSQLLLAALHQLQSLYLTCSGPHMFKPHLMYTPHPQVEKIWKQVKCTIVWISFQCIIPPTVIRKTSKKETIPRHSAWIEWNTNVTSKHASKAITWPFYFDASFFDHPCTLNYLAGVFIFFQSEDYFSGSKNIISVWTVRICNVDGP